MCIRLFQATVHAEGYLADVTVVVGTPISFFDYSITLCTHLELDRWIKCDRAIRFLEPRIDTFSILFTSFVRMYLQCAPKTLFKSAFCTVSWIEYRLDGLLRMSTLETPSYAPSLIYVSGPGGWLT